MRFNKDKIIALFIISLFILLYFLPNIIELIPSTEVKSVITNILLLVIFLFLIYVTYNDLRKSKYTTTVYIVVVDIIVIIGCVVYYCTYYFYTSSIMNIKILLYKNNIRSVCWVVLLCTGILLHFLQSERFMKKK